MDAVALGLAQAAANRKARPNLYKPTGLRRWYADLGDCLNLPAHIVCMGDSTVQGVGSDNLSPVSEAAAYVTNSFPGVMRTLFAKSSLTGQFDPGEGMVKLDDYRVAVAGGAAVSSKGPFGSSRSLTSGTQSLTITTVTGTRVDIVWWHNGSTTGPPIYNIDGAGDVTAPAGSAGYNKVSITGLANTAHSVVIKYNAAASAGVFPSSIAVYKADAITGVPVHRVGTAGKTSIDLAAANLGASQTEQIQSFFTQGMSLAVIDCIINDWLGNTVADGVLNSTTTITSATAGFTANTHVGRLVTGTGIPAGTTIASVTNSTTAVLSAAATATASGVTLQFSVSPAKMTTNLQSIISVATGATYNKCVLLVDPPLTASSEASFVYKRADYTAALRALAAANDHVAYISMPELFGTNAQASTSDISLMISGTSHPNRRGYGVMARTLFRAITGPGLGAL